MTSASTVFTWQMVDPIISSLEETGLPPWNDGREPICPVCGATCDTIYRNGDYEIVGCDVCLTAYDAWDMLDE